MAKRNRRAKVQEQTTFPEDCRYGFKKYVEPLDDLEARVASNDYIKTCQLWSNAVESVGTVPTSFTNSRGRPKAMTTYVKLVRRREYFCPKLGSFRETFIIVHMNVRRNDPSKV